jgi:hypothetical protein
MPLFFKLWFALAGTLALGTIAVVIYVIVAVLSAGPSGIGHGVGSFGHAVVQGFNGK